MEIRRIQANHPTTSHHNRTLACRLLTLTFEQGLFIASIGKTISKDGAKGTSIFADASDTEAESVNLREVVDLVGRWQ
jgi:hypothetical protein